MKLNATHSATFMLKTLTFIVGINPISVGAKYPMNQLTEFNERKHWMYNRFTDD